MKQFLVQETTQLEKLIDKETIFLRSNTPYSSTIVLRNTEVTYRLLEFIHDVPNVHTEIEIKAVVYDSAKLDINAVVVIPKGAEDVQTYLRIKCLLVGENAKAKIIPSMEILENAVKAGHGASIGHIDPIQLYYLQSRGLSQEESIDAIVAAFLQS